MYNANIVSSLTNINEVSLLNMWKDFANKNEVILYLCVSSVLRRGILEDKIKLQHDDSLINDVFRVCGLSSIMESLLFCDRFIQF